MRDQEFQRVARELGHDFDGELKIGGRYVPLLRDGATVYISGQIPRVGDTVQVTGRACAGDGHGNGVSLTQAQRAAAICVMRALALLQRSLGSLDRVRAVLRITVYVQCSDDFTQHSEVADGASDVLYRILGEAGRHTRTSVGVRQLPKNATVELDMIATADDVAAV